jgi:anti-sigma factor RsiW
MTPDTASVLLHAYLDGELDAASTIEMEARLKGSTALRQELARLTALQHTVQARATRFTAPAAITENLFAPIPASRRGPIPAMVQQWWRALAIGTSIAAAVLLVWTLSPISVRRDIDSVQLTEVVSAHARSLLADHLTDLASAERHSVKPWLSNRLDFAPRVLDLSSEGFALVGGRLEYLGEKRAAAIVYQYRQHIINVFVWPSAPSDDHSIRAATHRGYNTAKFASDGLSYWAVSDLNPQDLRKLATLLQSPAATK